MSGFKVGDKVVYNGSNPGIAAQAGATALIIEIKDGGSTIVVIWDDTPQRKNQINGGYYTTYFKLVKPKIDYMQITRDMVGGR